jgi:GT2 family glycosyltransferase
MKPKVSVLYISNRYGGVDILKSSLDRQTFKDFELVFIDGIHNERKDEVANYFINSSYKVKHLPEPIKPERAIMGLTFAINEGFRNCDGDLLVLLQDFIYVPSYGIQKYVDFFNDNPNAFVTGVSHQYYYPCKEDITNPKGKITLFESDYIKKPDIKCWTDPRDTGLGQVRQSFPVEWETNWAACPMSAIKDLGGVDESYAYNGFNYDNVNLSQRAEFLGYKFYLDPTNEVFCFSHDKWHENPFKKANLSNHEYHFKTMDKIRKGESPARLKYLS